MGKVLPSANPLSANPLAIPTQSKPFISKPEIRRQARFEYPGASHHVMYRGNHGEDIFQDDRDRKMFLATLVEAKQMTGWRIYAYVLMRNHYHLLLQTPEANLVAGMKWFQGSYTQRFNAVHHTRGHLYQGRTKANPVQFGKGNLVYFRLVSSYIHLNPFRARLCGIGYDQPLESYLWSRYPAYIGFCKRPSWLQCSQVYRTHGLPASGRDALRGYKAILTELKLTEKELCGLKNTNGVKQAVAWCLHQNTAITLPWIADRLNMGHRSNASRNVSAFVKRSDTETTAMKERMHVLTG